MVNILFGKAGEVSAPNRIIHALKQKFRAEFTMKKMLNQPRFFFSEISGLHFDGRNFFDMKKWTRAGVN